jgi:hypothetical protein
MFRPPGMTDGSAPPTIEIHSPVEDSQRFANETRPLPSAPRTMSGNTLPPTPAAKDYPRQEDIGTESESLDSVVLNEAPAMEHAETESHALATANHDEKGAAQLVGQEGRSEVKDLGWTERHSIANVPNPLVGGLKNEDLWILVRRFDKVNF